MPQPEKGRIIDKTTYIKGVANMTYCHRWEKVFVADGRQKKDPVPF